jgi:RNA polymerase sigma-70 factor (ECF subfamily)
VYTYVRYRIADVAEAEDLTSEILERALTYLASFDSRKGSFSTWLFRIAHNTLVNHLRKRRYQNDHCTALGDARHRMEDLAADAPTPEQVVVRDQETAHLLRCLCTLSLRQQEILSLRFAGQLTNREIARILEMNERTVSVTILRALRKIRQAFAACAPSPRDDR